MNRLVNGDMAVHQIESFGLISIIMAAYNAEKTIEDAICSVQSQTVKNWELIIVDDGSTDKTANIVRTLANRDSRIKLVVNRENSGVSQTRLNALMLARGQWIAILDSDDKWASSKLQKQIEVQLSKQADLIYTGSLFINQDGDPIDWYLHAPLTINYRQLLKQNLISNSSVMVRKDLYAKCFKKGDMMHEDFAIWLTILKNGGKAFGIDEPLLIYRIHSGSKSANKIKAAQMQWNTYKYVGINAFRAAYYMCFYMINGMLKYRHLR